MKKTAKGSVRIEQLENKLASEVVKRIREENLREVQWMLGRIQGRIWGPFYV